jgi:hypothetical protein
MQTLFEYINSITETEDMEITAMNDGELEIVILSNSIDDDSKKVELFLLNFEGEMITKLKEISKKL